MLGAGAHTSPSRTEVPLTRHAWVLGCLFASACLTLGACGSSGNTNGGTTDDGALGDGLPADTAAGDDAATTTDSSTPADTSAAPDTGAPDSATPTDTGTTPKDSGTPPTDTGTTPKDSGTPPTDTGTPPVDAGPSATAMIGPCRIYPPDNPWNRDVSADPLSAHNADYMAMMATTTTLHPDWGDWSTVHYGIPWQIGTGAAQVPFHWTVSWGASNSDPMNCTGSTFCYPIPTTAKIEGGPSAKTGADRHVLYLDTAGAPNDCTLYEIYNAQNYAGAPWNAANGAIFHLGSNALRPDGWTSADAAGLPILPGLVRYDEVAAGAVKHAIRFTMANTANYFIHPGTHGASNKALYYPPMGLRLRLKAGTNVSTASAQGKVIFAAMKKYGIILADNGSDWYFSGDSDDRWTSALMGTLNTDFGKIRGSDFEVVESGTPVVQPP